jgi:bacterioferritin (cytochrome b1)
MSILVSEEKLRAEMEKILHGDEEHRKWLKDQIEKIIEECKKFP